MSEKKVGIYQIENKVNNKKYIGKSVDIIHRLWHHKNLLKKNKHINKLLQLDWNNYGEENFCFSIIKECLNEKLNCFEEYYIEYYNSYKSEYGYNVVFKNKKTQKVKRENWKKYKIDIDILKQKIEHEHKTIEFVANLFNCNTSCINKACRKYNIKPEIYKYKLNIGKIFETKNYGKLIILELIEIRNKTIYIYKCKFLEDNTIVKASISSIKNGTVKNKNKPIVYGKGYIGEGKYNKKDYKLYYTKWTGMLQRCYCEKYIEKCGSITYYNCEVCDRWLNFQNFCSDICLITNTSSYSLDKDKYYIDKNINTINKIYSLETCCFLTKKENSALVNFDFKRKEYSYKVKMTIDNLNIQKSFDSVFDAIIYCKNNDGFSNIYQSLISKTVLKQRNYHGTYKGEKIKWEKI